MSSDDLIVAFFPCIYFCENNDMYFKGVHFNLRHKTDVEKVRIILERSEKRQYFYKQIVKLFGVAKGYNLRLIIENPFSPFHYLVNNFPSEPSLIDMDRQKRGDFFTKPTQYWFINCERTYGSSIQKDKEHKTLNKQKCGKEAGLCSEERSMISPDYARNWICDFVIGKTQKMEQQCFDF